YLGWLGRDEQYLEEGRGRYGKDFRVNARLDGTYINPFNVPVRTRHALDLGDDPSPYRGCNHKDPGHGWNAGRAQRTFGFLAAGTVNRYCSDAEAGRLPAVTFVTPWVGGPFRTDDHPRGDIALGQRFIEAIYSAFIRSPQWRRGALILMYDEWGGFFDHVRPPVVPDDRNSSNDFDNFGQLGFRVPSLIASPYARRGYVDHNLYDHTSVLRFL